MKKRTSPVIVDELHEALGASRESALTPIVVAPDFVTAETEEWREGDQRFFLFVVTDSDVTPAPQIGVDLRVVMDARRVNGPRYDGIVTAVRRRPNSSGFGTLVYVTGRAINEAGAPK
jgi:hypothetical protein